MIPEKIFVGTPQVNKIQVYNVKSGRKVTVNEIILYNTDSVESNVTLTINTIDVMNIKVEAGQTIIQKMSTVLDQNDTLSVQQSKQNAINVVISGIVE